MQQSSMEPVATDDVFKADPLGASPVGGPARHAQPLLTRDQMTRSDYANYTTMEERGGGNAGGTS